MSDELISVIDLAVQLGTRKQTVFKILRRLKIEPTKRRSSNNRGQVIAYVTTDDARIVTNHLTVAGNLTTLSEDGLFAQHGVFYLLALEPDHDPGRFKVGFATNLSERLRHLRCSAPLLRVVRTWPCKLLWEKTAIESVTDGCEPLHTEVFRTSSIDSVLAKCERFFSVMPALKSDGP